MRRSDHDPGGYGLAVNITRRHLSKGQRAMIVVMADNFSKLEKFGGQKQLAEEHQVPINRLSQASTIAQYAPDLVDGVIHGGSLDSAYKVACEAKRATIPAGLCARRQHRSPSPQ